MKSLRELRTKGSLSSADLLVVLLGFSLIALFLVGTRARTVADISWFVTLAILQSAIYFLAVAVAFRRKSRSTFFIVLLFAAAFRLSIIFAPPYLSDDIYRYVWDGRVQAAGINPYRYVPADNQIAHLRDDRIYPKINRRDYAHTIYPPVAQVIYLFVASISESLTWMKFAMIGFEVITFWALVALLASFNLPRERLLMYAWHPLVVWEFAGSGHVDAAMIAFISIALLARRRERDFLTGFALAAATLTKLYPVVLVPAFIRRSAWRMPVAFVFTVIAAYSAYISVGAEKVFGFLPGYLREEGLSTGERFFILNLVRLGAGDATATTVVFLFFSGMVLLGLAAWSIRRSASEPRGYINSALILASTVTILISPHYAWYFAWIIPFLCFVSLASALPLLYLTTASFILYGVWLGESADRTFIINSFIYVPFAILSALVLWRRFLDRRTAGVAVEGASGQLKGRPP